MPRKKRPYDPKIKGCTPCARRRIHCDLRGPVCRKCESRGLKCTGLALELRAELPPFQGPGKTVSQVPLQQPIDVANGAQEAQAPRTQYLYEGQGNHGESRLRGLTWSEGLWSAHSTNLQPGLGYSGQGPESVEALPFDGNHEIEAGSSYDASEHVCTRPVSENSIQPALIIRSFVARPLTDPLASWKRQMCAHFSNFIATEMVAVDGPYNHWRHTLLPFAHYDDLVLQAIVAVSSCHIHLLSSAQAGEELAVMPSSSRMTFESFPAEFHQMYQTIFSRLYLDSDMRHLSPDKKNSVLMTILVLLIGAMVTGRSDFPLFYSLLGSAFDLMGGEETFGSSDIARFIKSQVAKFRFYGATMVDEQAGLQYISSTSHVTELLDSLSRQWSEHPEHNETVSFVNDLTRQALDMYLEQAQPTLQHPFPSTEETSDIGSTNSIVRVQHFIETLQSLPPGASCEQVLIWATFVAASGCVLDEHIQFFEGVLRRHYARNKFLNVLAGLEALHKIWARNRLEKWTSLIAQTRTLVM